MEEGPNADLSIYKQDNQPINNSVKQEENKMNLFNEKPVRPKMIFVING